MYYVYFLVCADKRTYIGCTDNLKERLERHKNKQVPATEKPIAGKVNFLFSVYE